VGCALLTACPLKFARLNSSSQEKAQPGASRSGFNENFPLAYGHSSRTLRFKIPVPLR